MDVQAVEKIILDIVYYTVYIYIYIQSYCADSAQFIESYCAAKWYGYITIIGTVIHMRPIT